MNVFTVTFVTINASLMNESINFSLKILSQMFEWSHCLDKNGKQKKQFSTLIIII